MTQKGKIITSRDGFKWYVEGGDDYLVINDGEYVVFEFLKEFEAPMRVFVDVGAHVGEYAIRMSRYYTHVYAIEPNPRAVKILEKNIELNNAWNVEVINVACGDSDGIGHLGLRGGSSTLLDVGGNIRTIQVPIRRLDEIIEKAHVIKIDVEGYEEKVIRGTMRLIEKCKPVIVIEHHEYRGYKQCQGMRQRIRKLLSDYHTLCLDIVHWAYLPKDWNLTALPKWVAIHWFNKCLLNMERGRPWYYGLPYSWWHGASLIDLLFALPEHIENEPLWIEWLERELD